MTDPIFGESSLLAGKFALDGLAKRQEMIGRNLANADTPEYKAMNVDFESTLKMALNKEEPLLLQKTNPGHLASPVARDGFVSLMARQGGSTRADGNNVDVEVEMNELAETGVRYQAIVQLVNKKLQILKSVAR